MSNPNPERDERVKTPEQIYIHPTSAEYHLNKWPLEESEYVEYARPEIAATRMRDLCVGAIKALRATPHGAAYNNAINDAIHKVESLTLEGEQEKSK